MDFINSFFSGAKIEPKIIKTIAPKQIKTEAPKEEELKPSKKYAIEFVERFKDKVWKRFDEPINAPDAKKPLRKESNDANGNNIYTRYRLGSGTKQPTNMPIECRRQEILRKIGANTVTILSGPTGCGKTTQVPQYIFDEYCDRREYCNIIIAQPRRIAARSNAKRVCAERGWGLGALVGYQIGSDQRAFCSDDTRILFCTTGIMVEKLLRGKKPLANFTHVILDEVHERDKDMDFLMILIYKYLNPDIRVILMSATMDVNKFTKYYDIPRKEVPVLSIDVPRQYSVEEFYLDDIDKVVECERREIARITDQMWRCAERLIVYFDHIDRTQARKQGISKEEYKNSAKPTVLVFLPGIYEIKQMYDRLDRWAHLNRRTKILRIVLHSTVEPIMSELAMQPLRSNSRKIILATNMAESSITVPDVKYVIDFCLTKNLIVEGDSSTCLKMEWATRANCVQRQGRTGRVTSGYCFRLVSREFYEQRMRASAKPELVTSPLENIVLKTKQMKIGRPEEVLALAMDRPKLNQVARTVLRLKDMGALLCTTNGEFVDRDGDMTNIGKFMTKLPIDVTLSKFILMGYCFGVINECIVIAASLNCSRPIHKPNVNKSIKSYSKLLEFANGSGSDLFASLNAYSRWRTLRDQNHFGDVTRKEGQRKEAVWATEHFLDIHALRECNELIKEIRFRLRGMKLCDTSSKFNWNPNEKYIALKVVISGAFYPNYFSRSTKSSRESTSQQYSSMYGKDPCDTVYFTGFSPDSLPHLYFQRIRHLFATNSDGDAVVDDKDMHMVKVTHPVGTEKVFVTFLRGDKEADQKEYGVACQPGFVLTEVYKSQLLPSFLNEIPIIANRDEALEYGEIRSLRYRTNENNPRVREGPEYNNYVYPKKFDKFVLGYIVHTINCGRFWIQPSHTHNDVQTIHSELNSPNAALEPFTQRSEVLIGILVAANYPSDDGGIDFHRGKVVSVEKGQEGQEPMFQVRFLDFGNSRSCRLDELRRMTGVAAQFKSLPPYCFECTLSNIQPSQITTPDGIWSKRSKEDFIKKTDGIEVEAEVYSCVNGIVRAIIRIQHKNATENINEYLKEKRYAEFCEESFASKQDHLEREKAQRFRDPRDRTMLTLGVIQHLQDEEIPLIPPPRASNGTYPLQIKGPFSPLRIGLYGLAQNTTCPVRVIRSSVNGVLLENEPNDLSEKHLVAVHVCQNDKNEINLRNTTLMPNMRIFGPLMGAIFAPRMKLKPNKKNTHYARMLTGLGCDASGKAISSKSDLEFELDATFNKTDLERINEIRTSLNVLISDTLFVHNPRTGAELENIQNNLIALLSTKRPLVPDESVQVTWTENTTENFFDDRQKATSIFPAHRAPNLCRPDLPSVVRLKSLHDRMEADAKADIDLFYNGDCQLCNKAYTNLPQHLLSRQHTDQVTRIENEVNR